LSGICISVMARSPKGGVAIEGKAARLLNLGFYKSLSDFILDPNGWP